MKRLSIILLSATILCCMPSISPALRMAPTPPPLAANAVPVLIERLKSEDPNIQANGLTELARVKPIEDAKDAIPAVMAIAKQKMKNPNDWKSSALQTEAMAMLAKLPKTPESMELLFSAADLTYSPEKCRTAEEQQAITASSECRMYSQISSAAAYGLPVNENTLERIKKVLGHPNASVREAVLTRFRVPEKLPKGAAEILQSVLVHDKESYVRLRVAQVIEEKDKGNPAYVPAFIAAIKREKTISNVPFYVTQLAVIGATPVQELSLFIKLLSSSENDATRYYSAKIIGQMGPKAQDAVPTLINSLASDRHPLTRAYAAEALGKVASKQNEAARQALVDALKDPDAETQKQALLALRK